MLKPALEALGFTLDLGERLPESNMACSYDAVMLSLSDVEALDCLQQLRRRTALPVLVYAVRDDDAERILALELGADDCLHPDCRVPEIAARLRAVVRRTTPVRGDDDWLQAGTLRLSPARRQALLAGAPLELTSAEFNILELLLRHAGVVVERCALFEQGLGRSDHPLDRSVDTHIGALRRKLGRLPDGRWWIGNVRNRGFILLR
jgi:two-component system OmpR family response regulator/two-component system response regulator CpxR